ncbi:MAG TPA: hypothetical protein VMZ91_10630 [Candidatus Paceibacterota bacterium]|nr:hypothetical protein [Candidatus Paceibacterota bacterium]
MKLKKDATLITDDFWYDLFDGGYIKPEKLLEDQVDIDSVEEAISILEDFRESLDDILEEI